MTQQEQLIARDKAARDKFEREFELQRDAIVEVIRTTGNVAKVTEVLGVTRGRFYKFLDHDKEFARQIQEARAEAHEWLEELVRCRAVEGFEKTKTKKVRIVDDWGCDVWVEMECVVEHQYDNNLLLRLLEANKPEKWRRHSSVEVDPGQKSQTLAGLLLEASRENAGFAAMAAVKVAGSA